MHRYIALDTETTGIDFCSSQVIQCGAIFLDESTQPIHKKEWNINYIPEKFSWDTEAEEIHGIAKSTSQTHGVAPEVFLKEFEQEIVKHYGINADSELHIIAANAHFDYIMLDMLWNAYRTDTALPLSRRMMDISSLALLVLGDVGMTTILEKLGISTDDGKRHSALYDAELHLKIFHTLVSIARQEGIAPVWSS